MIIDKLDSFISKARLGDILSYVPDITKPGQRTNLTKIFDTILVRIGRKDYCCSWSWPSIAKQKKVVSELLLSRRLFKYKITKVLTSFERLIRLNKSFIKDDSDYMMTLYIPCCHFSSLPASSPG